MFGDNNHKVTKMFLFFLFLEQELEQELAEQKSLLQSVASLGEEILTQHSAAETSGGVGYVSFILWGVFLLIHQFVLFLRFHI